MSKIVQMTHWCFDDCWTVILQYRGFSYLSLWLPMNRRVVHKKLKGKQTRMADLSWSQGYCALMKDTVLKWSWGYRFSQNCACFQTGWECSPVGSWWVTAFTSHACFLPLLPFIRKLFVSWPKYLLLLLPFWCEYGMTSHLYFCLAADPYIDLF